MTIDGKEIDGNKYNYITPYSRYDKAGTALLNGQSVFLDSLGNIQAICPTGRAEWVGSGKNRQIYGFLESGWTMLNSRFDPVSPLRYDKISRIHPKLAKVQKNKLWGIIDTLGNVIAPCIYRNIEKSTGDFIMVENTEREKGIIYKNGKLITPMTYNIQDIGPFVNNEYGVVGVINRHDFGIIDSTGREVLPSKYMYADKISPNDSLCIIRLSTSHDSHGYGAINKAGKIIIETKYDKINIFPQGAITFSEKDDLYSYFNLKGELKLSSERSMYEWKGHIRTSDNSMYYYYDYEGNLVKAISDEDYFHAQGNYYDRKTDSWGYSRNRRLIIPCMYDYLKSIDNTHFEVEKKGKTGIIDINNKVILPIKYDRIDIIGYNRCIADKGEEEAIFDWYGKRLTHFYYNIKQSRHDSTLFIVSNRKSQKWGIVNIDGKEVMPPIYEESKPFFIGGEIYIGHGYYLVLRNNDLYGIFNTKTSKEEIPCRYYHYINKIGNNVVSFLENNKRGAYVTTEHGIKIIPTMYDMIRILSNGVIVAQKDGKWGVIDEDNNIIIPFENKYIERYYNDILLVTKEIDPQD